MRRSEVAFAARERRKAAHAADGARGEVRAAPPDGRHEQLYRGVVGALEERAAVVVDFARHPQVYLGLFLTFERRGRQHRYRVRLGERPEHARAGGQRPGVELVADACRFDAQPFFYARGRRVLDEQLCGAAFERSYRVLYHFRLIRRAAREQAQQRIDERPERDRGGHREAGKAYNGFAG